MAEQIGVNTIAPGSIVFSDALWVMSKEHDRLYESSIR